MTLGELLANLPALPGHLVRDAAAWCREGRVWALRIPPLLFMLYLEFRFLTAGEPEDYWTIFSPITLAVHEWGHLFFAFLGEFMGIAGGTIFQLAAPLLAAIAIAWQRDYFGVCFIGSWAASSIMDMAVYMADARAQSLPLVSPVAGDPLHDWNYLLSALGLLRHDAALAALARLGGHALMFASILAGAWLVYRMAVPPKESTLVFLGNKNGGDTGRGKSAS